MKQWTSPIAHLTMASAIVLAMGVTVFSLGVWQVFTAGRTMFLGPSASVIAAALAGLITAQSITTWKQQRQLDRDRANFGTQQNVYAGIAEDLVNTFTSGSASPQVRALRANAALWASPETVEELSAWQAAKAEAMTNGKQVRDDIFTLTEDSQRALKTQVANVVLAMRKDLLEGQTDLSAEDVEKSIFNDSHPPHPSTGNQIP